ncbi:MAG: 16S rRNA processing protein RimM [Oscillospiraceae bacterium]|nr:16S rRNA processing protein RimM [Oscillospiraceae bacterium]
METNLLDAGEIVGTHGVRGELRVVPWADSPEFLLDFGTLYVDGAPCPVESARVHKTLVLVKLRGVDDLDAAQRLRGRRVQIDRAGFTPADGAVFIADLIGLPVLSGGAEIGRVADVLTMPGNDVYVVRGEHEYMIPAVREFVEEIDTAAGFVRVRLIPGMRTDEN